MVGKKNSYRKKREVFSGVQRYSITSGQSTEDVAETSQTTEKKDDDNEPTCVGASRKKMKTDDAKQPDLSEDLQEDEYRLISLKNLRCVL